MAGIITTLALFAAILSIRSGTQAQFSPTVLTTLAKNIGNTLSSFVKNATQFDGLYQKYKDGLQNGEFLLKEKDGSAITSAMKQQLERVLKNKIQSIQTLSEKAEELNANYTWDKDISTKNFDFYDSKFLEDSGKLPNLTLVEVPTFASIPVNLTYSTVHVPTDVYKGSKTILNSAKWTQGMDKHFRENMEREPSLLWQLVGTSTGVYRAYPGYKWRTDNTKDMYDHRRRGWYIQGSSSPKDMVILLDLSGSMTGSKIAIVKLAATYLLDTLQENDFVTVVIFNEKSYTLCEYIKNGPCKNVPDPATLGNCNDTLLQATVQNKEYLKTLVKYVCATHSANVSFGFRRAVSILEKARTSNQTSSGCIQTINFFTDGVEGAEAKKTSQYLDQPDVQKLGIRVFGYLVGREKGSPYKPVQNFACANKGYFYTIETLSDVRENVSKYMDVLSRPLALTREYTPTWIPIYLDQLGLGLMITVVAPIFDRHNKDKLLGVVGTDVALPQLTGSVPSHEVGVNGYGFAINNNGFIVFHPLLKEGDNPPNLALSDVTLKTDSNLEQLSQQMIDRITGNITLKKRHISKDLKRVSPEREYNIYFTDINGTSFSSAVAVPVSSWYKMDFTKRSSFSTAQIDKLKKSATGETVIVAPWRICDGIVPKARSSTPRYIPTYADWNDILTTLAGNPDNATELCDANLLANLLFDAEATRLTAAKWNVVENDTSGILSVFAGTHGGLVRALYPGQSQSPVSRDMTREPVYHRTADFTDEGTVVVSAPYKLPASKSDDDSVLNASMPITITKGANSVLAAVVGLQMKDEVLQKILLDKEVQNNLCTDNETYACYLIDEDAFVVASNQEIAKQEIGKSFGAVRGQVMGTMVNESLYKRIYFKDIQAKCSTNSQTTSSAMRLINPLMAVSSYVIWWTQTLFWTLVQFNVFSFFSGKSQVLAEDAKVESCTQRVPFFKANPANIDKGHGPQNLKSLDCNKKDVCLKPFFSATQVPKTNLVLVVINQQCTCPKTNIPTMPEKVASVPFTPPTDRYRRLPQLKCYSYSKDESKECGSGSRVTPLKFLLVMLPLVYAFFTH